MNIFKTMLHHRTDIFFDRHPDQLMLCSLYAALRAQSQFDPEAKFQQIADAYMEMNRDVLGSEVPYTILHRIKNCSDDDNQFGDIISLYNEVFVPSVKPFWKSFKDEVQVARPRENINGSEHDIEEEMSDSEDRDASDAESASVDNSSIQEPGEDGDHASDFDAMALLERKPSYVGQRKNSSENEDASESMNYSDEDRELSEDNHEMDIDTSLDVDDDNDDENFADQGEMYDANDSDYEVEERKKPTPKKRKQKKAPKRAKAKKKSQTWKGKTFKDFGTLPAPPGGTTPTDLDVISGRGGGSNKHEGNVLFRDEARKLRTTYQNSTSKEEVRAPASGIRNPTPLDILRGRGGLTNHHEGNMRFRDEARQLRSAYRHATATREEKYQLSVDLVQRVKEYGGRFLEKGKGGKWYEMSERDARKKASQVLREEKWD